MSDAASAHEWRAFIEGRFGKKKPIHMTVEEISLVVMVDILEVLEGIAAARKEN